MQSYKGRTVKKGQKVHVYRNLHKQGYSVRDAKTGKVLGHCDSILISDCSFYINQNKRAEIANGANRMVHAWIIGHFEAADIEKPSQFERMIYFNPKKTKQFVDTTTDLAVDRADEVFCRGKFSYACGVNGTEQTSLL